MQACLHGASDLAGPGRAGGPRAGGGHRPAAQPQRLSDPPRRGCHRSRTRRRRRGPDPGTPGPGRATHSIRATATPTRSRCCGRGRRASPRSGWRRRCSTTRPAYPVCMAYGHTMPCSWPRREQPPTLIRAAPLSPPSTGHFEPPQPRKALYWFPIRSPCPRDDLDLSGTIPADLREFVQTPGVRQLGFRPVGPLPPHNPVRSSPPRPRCR